MTEENKNEIVEGNIKYLSEDAVRDRLGLNTFQDFMEWHRTKPTSIFGGRRYINAVDLDEYLKTFNPNIQGQGETTPDTVDPQRNPGEIDENTDTNTPASVT